MPSDKSVESAYRLAVERFAEWDRDVESALQQLKSIPISLHCWQGDDVGGFEDPGQALGDGLAVTGNYPGKATTPQELRQDLEKVYSLLPGKHRLNLHAFYGEFAGQRCERNDVDVSHFEDWMAWASTQGLGLDFNPTFFSHPLAKDGFTLSHSDESIRRYWIEHGQQCRKIAAEIGKRLGSVCVNNFWIPDGFKDTPVDRTGPRQRLLASLDEIFAESYLPQYTLDAVEAKLFGIGSESYTTGSHEFYLAYAVSRQKVLCLDAGHFHPTEQIADKISSVLQFVPRLLLHVSRGVRWDSDHVVTLHDDLLAMMLELARGGYWDRVHIGLDFFDASINRIAAWVIGARNVLKAILIALLDPTPRLMAAENSQDYTSRLAIMEEAKTMPVGAVWDYYCLQNDVAIGDAWLSDVKTYEGRILSRRGLD